ncbi:MAG: IMP cyclohydrolase [Spirochaetales bacterium]|nr:MAG: IMP cyclohydrolase [Spirochaetales bacterium]
MSKTSIYRAINTDTFPETMEITFSGDSKRQTLLYQKATWTVDGEERGLRYGENPDQQASLYRLINGNLSLGEVESISPGRHLASDIELLQSGKHPGKINVTDADSALNILRYLSATPATVIVKHNNPCGVAIGGTLAESYTKAFLADRIAAFGGAVAVNRELDQETAEQIAESYSEVVVAPEYAPGTLEILGRRKNLRIMRIANIGRLQEYVGTRVVEFSSLIDGGIVAQWSQVPEVHSPSDFQIAHVAKNGADYTIARQPTQSELADMYFGWLVEFGVTSNSVIYVKDGATVGSGTGEQDRVGVAEIARDKAYRRLAERMAFDSYGQMFGELTEEQRAEVWARAADLRGGLRGSVMISDAFFPFTDGPLVGIREGISAIVQPGGAMRDHEVISLCNESGITMVFTGQRSFRH